MRRRTGMVALAMVAAGGVALTAPLVAQAQGMGAGRGAPPMSFEAMDTDKNGSVTPEELRALRQGEIAGLDADANGLLSAEELTAFHMKMMAARAAMMTERMIADRELDGDGQLGVAEMIARPVPMPMFERLDADEDGAVSKAEFDAGRERMRERRPGHGPGRHGRQGPDRGAMELPLE